MSRLPVETPPRLPGLPAVPLGTLTPALRRLACLQGTWPPTLPTHPHRAGPPSGDLESGRQAADAAADAAADLLVVDSGAEPVPGLVALAVLLHLEPVAAVGTAGGPRWADRLTAVRAALPAVRALDGDPQALLDALGDPALAHLSGLLERSAQRRTPVLVGSSAAVIAALLLADRLAPGAAAWALAGSSSSVAGAERALTVLRLEPVLDLRLPGAGGAVLAHRVLRAALDLLDEAPDEVRDERSGGLPAELAGGPGA